MLLGFINSYTSCVLNYCRIQKKACWDVSLHLLTLLSPVSDFGPLSSLLGEMALFFAFLSMTLKCNLSMLLPLFVGTICFARI